MIRSRCAARRSPGLLLLVLLAACGAPAPAADGPQLHVESAWTPAAPGAGPAEDAHDAHAAHGGGRAAVYLTLRNSGSEPDRLVGAATPLAEQAEIHRSRVDDGIMRMRRVEAVEVAPGAVVELRPGDYHIMLLGVHRTPVAGERFPLRLEFERGGAQDVEVEVRTP